MGLLERLKKLSIDAMELDEAVELVAQAKSLRAEYAGRNLPVPDLLDDSLRSLEREIEAKRRDTLELRLKQVRREREATMSAAERRDKLALEEKELEAALAGSK